MSNIKMLSDDALEKVNGGMGQTGTGVGGGSARLEKRFCPKCCKPGDSTYFNLDFEKGTATCTTCPPGDPTTYFIETMA